MSVNFNNISNEDRANAVMKKFNRKLEIFNQIEAKVERSDKPSEVFSKYGAEWQRLFQDLNDLLVRIDELSGNKLRVNFNINEGFKVKE